MTLWKISRNRWRLNVHVLMWKAKKSNRTEWRNGYWHYPLPPVRLPQSSKPLNEGTARGKPLASIIKHIFEEVKRWEKELWFICVCWRLMWQCFWFQFLFYRRKRWRVKKLKKKQVWVLALCADGLKQMEWNGLRVLTEFLLTTGARKIYSGF